MSLRRLAPEGTTLAAPGGRPLTIAVRGDLLAAVAVALLATVAAMIALSPIGPGNDQTLFVYYGWMLREGAVPYVEIWDNKQPGIFAFYAGAAALFGEGWPAARTAFAVWLGLGAGMVAWIGRRVAPGTAAWWIAPIVTVGLALIRNEVDRPAQVESLVSVPLVAILLLGLFEPATTVLRRLRWIAVGALVGVVSTLKLVLAPVAAAIVAVLVAARLGRRETTLPGAAATIGWTLVGFTVLWAPILAYIAASGAWTEFRWTMLDYPRRALVDVEMQNPWNLVNAARWLAITTVPLLLAAALACAYAIRAPRSLAATVVAASLAWIVAGLVMFSTQRFSWWNTHMDMVVWPFGLMAMVGLALPAATGFARRIRTAAAALVVCGLALHAARFVHNWATDPDWPAPAVEVEALAIAASVAAAADTPCGTVYAIGDMPGVERVTGRRQALPTHGLWFGAFLPEQAQRLPDELRAARPDLVYFDRNERRDFLRKFPQTAAAIDRWLESEYRFITADGLGGRWHQRRTAPGDAANCPAPVRFTVPVAGR